MFKRKCLECGSTNLTANLTCRGCGATPRMASVQSVSHREDGAGAFGAGRSGQHFVDRPDARRQAEAQAEFERQGLQKRADESTPEWRARVNAWSREKLRNARMNSLQRGGVYTGWADQVIARIAKGETVSATCEAIARDVIRNRDGEGTEATEGGWHAGNSADFRGRDTHRDDPSASSDATQGDSGHAAPASARPDAIGEHQPGDGDAGVPTQVGEQADDRNADRLAGFALGSSDDRWIDGGDGDDVGRGAWSDDEVPIDLDDYGPAGMPVAAFEDDFARTGML